MSGKAHQALVVGGLLVAVRWTLAAADLLIEREKGAFLALLQVWLTGRLRATCKASCLWARTRDETPRWIKTHLLHEEGHLMTDTSIAKVMATLLRFSMTFSVQLPKAAGVTAKAGRLPAGE